jgi:threonine synthase
MSPLLFRSTNGQTPAVNLREAFLAGQAPDRGLYLPEHYPRLTPAEIAEFAELPYREVAFRVLRKFTEGVIPDDALATMCNAAYDFGVPLEVIQRGVYLMRLDQGPTASFKDFASQMMAQMFGRFLQEVGGQVTILTATTTTRERRRCQYLHHPCEASSGGGAARWRGVYRHR